MSQTPRFLSVGDVLILHAIAIEDQGGDPSIRDRGLLESAVAAPSQQVSGQFLHKDVPSIAAAYAFPLCNNHPFIDGNKRAGLAAMIAFLSDNGWRFDASADEAEPVILQLADGKLDKPAFTDWARKHMHEKPKMELRDFFSGLTWQQVSQMSESVAVGGSVPEATATTKEASQAIPVVAELDRLAAIARKEHNEQAYAYFNAMKVYTVALYRVAEDMGYEW